MSSENELVYWPHELIRRHMGHITGLLGVSSVDDLCVWDNFFNYKQTMRPDRMKVISSHGFEGIPPVIHYEACRTRYMYKIQDTGYTLCETDNNVRFIFVVSSMPDGSHASTVILMRKQMFRLKRWAESLASKETFTTPILADGLLDTIIRNTVGFYDNRREFVKYDINIKRGLVLCGPPGNGKTLTCSYINNLCTAKKIPFYVITSSKIEQAQRDDNLSTIFNYEGITLFDDIDIAYMSRKHDGKMACSILSAMDGLKGPKARCGIRIFTTNEDTKDLDPAFMRPGRIDKEIRFELPTEDLRRKLIMTWNSEIDIDREEVVERSYEYSFADVEAIKGILVSNKVMDGVWDLDKAFDDFEENRDEKPKAGKSVGFSQRRETIMDSRS